MIWILIYTNRMSGYENIQVKKYIENNNLENIILLDPNYISVFLKDNQQVYYYKGEKIEVPKKVYIKLGAMVNEHTQEIILSLPQNVLVINKVDDLENTANKFLTQNLLKKKNIDFIPTLKIKAINLNVDYIEDMFSFPLIIKSKVGSLGRGISKVETKGELSNLMDNLNLLDQNYDFLIQEYIKEGNIDYRIVVHGGEIQYALKREAQGKEFRANYNLGSKVTLIECDEKIKEIVKKIYDIFNLNVMGIDLIKQGDKYLVCEVNSNPGFSGFDSLGNNFVGELINYILLYEE